MSNLEGGIVEDLDYSYFQRRIYTLTGIDLKNYKSEQMHRRLSALMARCNAKNFVEFCKLLEKDQKMMQTFKDYFTINVSEFFRDENKFRQLQEDILPLLLKRGQRLDIWSAGCSYGAEPYSVAIILDQITPLTRHTILGTDIDTTILDKAAKADSYTTTDIRSVPAETRTKYFTQTGDKFKLTDRIRSRVVFKQHNLLRDPIQGLYDMILCRNVVIYFTDEAKDTLYHHFWEHLKPGGVLFVGGTEVLNTFKNSGFQTITTSFYRKVA
ncbi:MAG: protein-glutamate O-methyltransferase CheR [Chloroflexi bacterium]|nr:protein-glutamate O-methyltransferase CheR [Chloroflexota bacterium]